jgi:hypothetical protein
MEIKAADIFGFETEKPASIRSRPSFPVKTAMLPPEPSSTLTFRRSGWTSMFEVAAAWIIVGTIPASAANRRRGPSKAAVADRPAASIKRRRDKVGITIVFIGLLFS